MVRVHSRGLSPSGTDFKDFKMLIVCRPSSNDGVETINFLKDERGTWLRKCSNFVLVSSSLVVVFFCFLALSNSQGKILTANLVSTPRRRLVRIILLLELTWGCSTPPLEGRS